MSGTQTREGRRARAGWGIDPAAADTDPRRCPSCGTPILPGRAQCHDCYLRAQARAQCATERAWMTRNFPEYRPKCLFPEEYEDDEAGNPPRARDPPDEGAGDAGHRARHSNVENQEGR